MQLGGQLYYGAKRKAFAVLGKRAQAARSRR